MQKHIYISLLRGINVGGNNKIKMAELKAIYESLGFKNVTTYIQSGNVIFEEQKTDARKLEKAIEKAIKTNFGYDISVLLRTKEDIEWLLKNNPYQVEDEVERKKIYFFFLKEKPDSDLIEKLEEKIKEWPEHFKVIGNHAFLHAVNGYGRTKLNGNFVERNLKVKITARNWRTVSKLLEMVD